MPLIRRPQPAQQSLSLSNKEFLTYKKAAEKALRRKLDYWETNKVRNAFSYRISIEVLIDLLKFGR